MYTSTTDFVTLGMELGTSFMWDKDSINGDTTLAPDSKFYITQIMQIVLPQIYSHGAEPRPENFINENSMQKLTRIFIFKDK